MNFQHTEDRRMLADSLNRFVAEQYGFEARERIARSDEGYSRDMWRRFCEFGIIGAFFDESTGGFGGDGFDIAIVFEALGRGLVVEPFLDALIVGRALAYAGNERQQWVKRGLRVSALCRWRSIRRGISVRASRKRRYSYTAGSA